ncbi:LuxR C-terminal-related transcriptional regulator [Streptosporangium sp. 'caverna']|uniref:ATP-binding protein n=1 Tax=Streptosporangium sp. 'caverna' TaxID=2202249 RepID=UPI000D7E0190|nr:LuxR C-terminal-related transcriptional regulator [Streptosporangium sp. 'caverna']AWS41606.1 LuxR family transcriptional regulator [Streptosporangium sp. 'caverna']
MNALAPATSKRRRAQRLPSEVTSFVGRRHEVAEVKRLLSGAHVVTLTGVGGVGKTRLALRVAADVRRAFRDGVWLVELAALDRPELLVQTVAEALEIRDFSSRSLMEVLTDHLRGSQSLIILDNCEQLLHECAVMTEALIRAAPDLRILVTSRQTLGIDGEHTLTLPPLALPDSDVPPPSVEALAHSDAVRLFAERAEAILPDFAVTDDNREAVEGICRRLDGIPLAIELAAVRLRAMSVQQLFNRLDDRFRLLTAGSRAVLPRHQTLRALMDWSYALCTDQERLLWERVSVFAGGLDLEAAETVCSGNDIAREEIIDLVIGLVDKSVLIREEYPSGVRYRLLETIRQYGRDRLRESGEEGELQHRHCDYYRKLSAEAYSRLFGPSQVAWFSRLQLEHANLRVALEHCFTKTGETATGLGMAADLLYHWITSYYLGEGRRWLDRGLAADTSSSEVRARALWAGSWLAILQDDIPSATAMLEESRGLGELLGQEPVLAHVALYFGMVAMNEGDAESAVALYEEAATRHRATGDPIGLALTLIRLSLAHSFLGDSPRAVSVGEECIALCDEHEEGWHRAYAMAALGIELWRQGDLGRATELEKESLRFDRLLEDSLGIGLSVEALAWIATTEHKYRRAARLLGILRTAWQAIGAPLSGFGHLMRYHDECESQVRRALGESAFSMAVERGARLSYDEALSYALDEGASGDEQSDRSGRPSLLTPREMEIAQLVAQGMSNKEIAASLVIAQRTAEGHVEHILSKFGFTSRAQIAVWVGDWNRAAQDEHHDRG